MRAGLTVALVAVLLFPSPAAAADVHVDSSDRAGELAMQENADGSWSLSSAGVTLRLSDAEAHAFVDRVKPDSAPPANRLAGEAKSGTETLLADASQHGAILARFGRLLVYAPYFDQHLSWYPGDRTWVYHNLIRTQSTSVPTVDWMNGYVGTWRAADIRTAQWQDGWISRARELALRGYTALRIDDINPSEPLRSCATCAAYTPSWWLDANADFLERIRADLPGLTLECNISRWWTWGLPNPSADLLRIIRACDEIELERGYNDANLTDAHRTTLLNDWQGLMKREGKGWVHFVQDGRLDYAKGWFDRVNAKWYPNGDSPGWLMTNDMRAGLGWTGLVAP